ncbi:GTPase [Botrimarina hoheduenensis]|uniref:tRNA modification GTPase MnmE n=1 Tax=Botrimarina hoheduenensis TaxID=2528000 RepID=A0A5C5WFF5_9BACT|nr:GTPase [Botrimarina hoheduenensis]TWT48841.1 tRNA modification GTPase MnmE [Botrimarina hoheduenensis]
MTDPLTTARLVTAAGRSAVAVVRVEGPEAIATIDRCFCPAGNGNLASDTLDRIRFGVWRSTGEEVVAVRVGHAAAEIHCHGGVAAPAAVLHALAELGVADRMVEDTPAPSRSAEADALRALREAPTQRVAGVLLDQASGAFRDAIRTINEQLALEDVGGAQRRVQQLLSHRRLAERLLTPWRVTLAGPPNVGKSSLINLLVGYQRAIVFDRPGTTRDVVTATTAIDGWPVMLADTAGLRASDDPLEQAGVTLAEEEIAAADVVVLVRDAREAIDKEILGQVAKGVPVIRVANKCDLAPAAKLAPEEISTAAVQSFGVEALLHAIGEALADARGAAAPQPGEAVPLGAWRFESLTRIERAIATGDLQSAAKGLLALLSA